MSTLQALLFVSWFYLASAIEFEPSGAAALSPREQLKRFPDQPPTFWDPTYKDLPCPFYSSQRTGCTQYDSIIKVRNMQEMERYVNSELKGRDGQIAKPDIWILIQEEPYWVNPSKNLWIKYRKIVSDAPKDWFSDVDIVTKRPTPAPTRPPSKASSGSNFLADSIENFGKKMWPKCSARSDSCLNNVVYSPMSINSILTLLMLGSSAVTEQQLRSVLDHTNNNEANIQTSYRQLVNNVNSRFAKGGNNQLRIANGIFTFNTNLDPKYEDKIKRNFTGHIEKFPRVSNDAINTINGWVSEQTNGKINRVIVDLPSSSRLVGISTVYFKSRWAEPFGTEFTREKDFHVTKQETIRVQTMVTETDVEYVEDPNIGCKMIALPYEGSDMVMYLLLPFQMNGLRDVETKLNDVMLDNLVSKMKELSVSIQLPKFRISQKISLKEKLVALGARDLFTPDLADLSRMIKDGKVVLDDIVHETFIQVSETGTEAAAATTVFLTRGTLSRTFVADHPFIFFIRDKASKVNYFAGRVVRPDNQ